MSPEQLVRSLQGLAADHARQVLEYTRNVVGACPSVEVGTAFHAFHPRLTIHQRAFLPLNHLCPPLSACPPPKKSTRSSIA